MGSIAFFITILAFGLIVAAALIGTLIKFVPDEMDREHRD